MEQRRKTVSAEGAIPTESTQWGIGWAYHLSLFHVAIINCWSWVKYKEKRLI
jgi:hypothetical protein